MNFLIENQYINLSIVLKKYFQIVTGVCIYCTSEMERIRF